MNQNDIISVSFQLRSYPTLFSANVAHLSYYLMSMQYLIMMYKKIVQYDMWKVLKAVGFQMSVTIQYFMELTLFFGP